MTETLLRDDAFPVAASGFDVDLSPCDCRVGELYAVMVPDHNAALILEFRKRLSSGVLRFVKPGTDQEFNFHQAQWDDMRSDRRACRITEVKRGRSAAEIEDIDPLALLDPNEPNIKLKEQSARLKAAELLAKPLTVIVDNAWEFVGLSFQVCCEASGIHVIWAPVKTGEFKSYAERAFGYLNGLIWHRLDAGIPYKPQEMTARGLDPRPKAIQTIEWMYDRMWGGIVTVYHVEPHGEEQIVPALRWREGLLAADGRPTLDDVGEFDKLLGQSKICLLTAEGIRHDGERFHDKTITTDLLNRLLRDAPKRGQRKGLSSGKVFVLVTTDPGDASFVHVWDWSLRENIRLLNWRREYSRGMSWHAAKKIQEFVRQKNLNFHTDSERHAARAAYDRSLREEHPNLPFSQARKNAVELSEPRLIDGEYADLVKEPVSETEKSVVDVPQTLPARERMDDRIPDPGVRRGGQAYVAARRDPDMLPLQTLAIKHGIDREQLKSLADTGLVPTSKTEGVRRGPVLMSARALGPLIAQMESVISSKGAAHIVGVHVMHLPELEKRGLLQLAVGPVLKLMNSGESYYTRASVEALTRRIAESVKRTAPPDCVRLRVALRACNAGSVPWAGIVQAILEDRFEVFDIKSHRSKRGLADRLAVRDKECLSAVIAQELTSRPTSFSWIGNAAASEILGVNEMVVWKLMKLGALKKYDDAPLYSHFKPNEVKCLRDQMIFTSEIRLTGGFKTYRRASDWLRELGILPHFELKRGGWKAYSRAEVEAKLKLRVNALPPKPVRQPRPSGPWHGPNSPAGKLAAQQELLDASRIGYATAAAILGSTIYAVQMLAANGHLKARRGTTPFHRTEVDALAKRIVFISEIMKLSGYVSHEGVMNWLKNAGIAPLFRLKKGGVPVFERAVIEKQVARAEFVHGAHPRWIKRKLLDMVARGNSAYQASIVCGVSYATAKRWAAETAPNPVRGARGEYPLSTKRKLFDMVERGRSIRQAAISCAVNYKTAQRWKKAELAA